MANTPLFGSNIDPAIGELDTAYTWAQIADQHGLDMITIQDHPYHRGHLDTWTLLTALAMRTERVHLGTNVVNLPLRPPAVLAKAAATLDVISGGRVELGLGAGAFWRGINAFGGQSRSPGEAYTAFEDALHIIRGLWDNVGGSFTHKGEIYHVQGAQPGPAPAHPIRIWVGASGPRMLRLTGRMADGVLVSSTYESFERLLEINSLINEGAQQAGRSPDDIRRGYNLMGMVDFGQIGGKPSDLEKGILYDTPDGWVKQITALYHDYGQDTFILWPIGSEPARQLEVFATEIVPAVRSQLQ